MSLLPGDGLGGGCPEKDEDEDVDDPREECVADEVDDDDNGGEFPGGILFPAEAPGKCDVSSVTSCSCCRRSKSCPIPDVPLGLIAPRNAWFPSAGSPDSSGTGPPLPSLAPNDAPSSSVASARFSPFSVALPCDAPSDL